MDVFIIYAWVKSLKDKKVKTVFHGFIGIVNEYKCKRNILWIGQGRVKKIGDVDKKIPEVIGSCNNYWFEYKS